MFKNILLIFIVFCSLTGFASTQSALEQEYSSYYNLGAETYELYYCHRNVAKLLNHLELAGAELSELTVIILLDVEGQREIYPRNTRFDNEFKWHVFFMYDGRVYDQNIMYGENGLEVDDYFSLMLGSQIDLNDVIIRTVSGDIFHRFFYYEDGPFRTYHPNSFIERFLNGDEFPLERAQYLRWY